MHASLSLYKYIYIHTHTHTYTYIHICRVQLFRDPVDCNPPGSSVHGISQTQILQWVCHFFLQVIFLTQGLNSCLLHCRQILYNLTHQGSPCAHLKIFIECLLCTRHFAYMWPTTHMLEKLRLTVVSLYCPVVGKIS